MLGGELRGPKDFPVARLAPSDADDPTAICFAGNEEHLRKALDAGVGAILLPTEAPPVPKPAIAVAAPRDAFAKLLALVDRPLRFDSGVHPLASVHPAAVLDEGVSVGPFAVVEEGARLRKDVRVYAHAYVGERCDIGEGSQILPHAVLVRDVQVGARCTIYPGAVLGADGFGFEWTGEHRMKIPQVGRVRIGDDVEIGANSAVDRATMGETVVDDGTKLDNLVQIGHNSRIGKHGVIASFAGISGSTVIGDRLVMAGQAATSDHVEITDDVTLGGRTGVTSNIEVPGTYWGTPAQPFGQAVRNITLAARLTEFYDRLKKLERRMEKVESS
jgi:UDP-3-O-[3-hydroxymyristoyl] glucosamine N-acyltransferase